MKKAIAIAVYRRPKCFNWLIESLGQQVLPLDDYLKVVSIDKGDHHPAMVRLAAPFAQIVMTRKKHLGLNKNTFAPVREAFEVQGADQVIYLEEDFVLSPDTFNLVEWYIDNAKALRAVEGVRDVALKCLCRLPRCHLQTINEPGTIWLVRALQSGGLVIGRREYFRYVKPAWSHFRASGTWSKRIANRVRGFPGVYNAIPSLSRISNTGRESGYSVTKKVFDRLMKGHVKRTSREIIPFHCAGISFRRDL